MEGGQPPSFCDMKNKGAKIIASAILGLDGETIVVNDKVYYISPPTIKKIAGAGVCFASFGDENTVGDYLRKIKDIGELCRALSWFIAGDTSLAEELSDGTLDEVVHGIEVAVSMIGVENFIKLSDLTRSVSNVIARPTR